MTFSNLCNDIFWKSTTDYHVTDSVDAPMNNPYELKSIEYYLYLKNWIDAIEEGVNRVHILDGRIPHSLLLEIFTNKGIGTAILSEDGEKYYNEHE